MLFPGIANNIGTHWTQSPGGMIFTVVWLQIKNISVQGAFSEALAEKYNIFKHELFSGMLRVLIQNTFSCCDIIMIVLAPGGSC